MSKFQVVTDDHKPGVVICWDCILGRIFTLHMLPLEIIEAVDPGEVCYDCSTQGVEPPANVIQFPLRS